MHIIIGMPPHIIIMGIPAPIIAIILWQHSLNISIDMPSLGMTLQVIPLALISHVIFIMGTGIGIIPPIIGIMPPIIGIIPPIMGIMPPIIGMFAGIVPIGICIAVIISTLSCLSCLQFPPQQRRTAAVSRSKFGRDRYYGVEPMPARKMLTLLTFFSNKTEALIPEAEFATNITALCPIQPSIGAAM